MTAASFDARQAPVTGARGFFLGDYVGLDSFGSTFAPFYTEGVTAPANPTDEFYAESAPGSSALVAPRRH